MTEKEKPEQPIVKLGDQFHELLNNLRDGQAVIEYEKKMQKLVKAVHATGNQGSFQITITVKPLDDVDNTHLEITDRTVLKIPDPSHARTMLFANKNGRLSRRDPRQPRLPGMEEDPPTNVVNIKSADDDD